MIKLTYEGVTVETETVGQAVDIIKGLTAQPSLFNTRPACSDWFSWSGGENPPTFDGDDVAAVSLKFRNGNRSTYLNPSVLGLLNWRDRGHPSDIVAYKVIAK